MRILLFILSWLLPLTAYAADFDGAGFNNTAYKLSLTPQSTDISLAYLGYLFGNVDGVLTGAGSQILGTMFGVFNTAVLSLGGIILMYILLVSTLNTAHEGEVMGKKWSSIWIPLRSAIGVGLLVPKASGYSVIQIFMMWVIVQGIGAADSVWNAATGYLQAGGVLVTRPQNNPTSGSDLTNFSNMALANNILMSLTCVASIQDYLQTSYEADLKNRQPSDPPVTPPPNLFASIQYTNPNILIPGTTTGVNYAGVCGTIAWKTIDDFGTKSFDDPSMQDMKDMLTNARRIALRQMMSDMYASASRVVTYAKSPELAQRGIKIDQYINPQVLRSAAATYAMLVAPALNAKNTPDLISSQRKKMLDDGWLMAGSYYNIITRTNIGSTTINQDTSPPEAKISNPSQLSSLLSNKPGGSTIVNTYSSSVPYLDSLAAAAKVVETSTDATRPSAIPLGQLFAAWIPGGTGQTGTNIGSAIDSALMPLQDKINDLLNGWDGAPPLTKIAAIGSWLLFITDILLIIVFNMVGMGASLSVVPFMSLGTLAVVISQWLIPFVLPLLYALAVFGAMMAYYIPLVPYLIFTFASLGWFFATVEAMVAAPLVALGLVHPEGHEAFGKAESSILLVVNVFLKPTLLIFGFIAGIIVSYIALWLLNRGFGYIYFSNAISPGMVPSRLGVLVCLLLFISIYATTALTIVQKCFELITIVDTRVMIWLGHSGATDYGAQQSMQEVKGGAQGALEKVSSAHGARSKAVGEAKAARINKEIGDANTQGDAEVEGTGSNEGGSTGGSTSIKPGSGSGSGGGKGSSASKTKSLGEQNSGLNARRPKDAHKRQGK